MPASLEGTIAEIHKAPHKVVISVCGGGASAIGRLLALPGASQTVLEAVVPYSAPALADWLGGPPDQACSAQTARFMAMAGFLRACRLREPNVPVAGVACTASLATDRPKRGDHRAHFAVQTEALTATRSVRFEKGRRSRAEEERVTTAMVVQAVAEACGLDRRVEAGLFPSETIECSDLVAPEPWQDLLMGRVDVVRLDGDEGKPAPGPRAIFPGAFNPLHSGHRRMAELARELLRMPVEFELSIVNVDKPPLDYFQIERRTGQLAPSEAHWLTRLPTFEEKSRVFAGATFVVGTDTLRRIAEPRYYGGGDACRTALEAIVARGSRFLVFARADRGEIQTVDSLDLPEILRSVCRQVPPEDFREDISSTELRRTW